MLFVSQILTGFCRKLPRIFRAVTTSFVCSFLARERNQGMESETYKQRKDQNVDSKREDRGIIVRSIYNSFKIFPSVTYSETVLNTGCPPKMSSNIYKQDDLRS